MISQRAKSDARARRAAGVSCALTGRPWHGCHPDAICARTAFGEHSCTCHEGSGRVPGSEGFWGDGNTCRPWHECTVLHTYETRAPDNSTNRECAAVSACELGEIERVTPTCDPNRLAF